MKIAINALILKKQNTGIGIYARCLLEELVKNKEHDFVVFVPDVQFIPFHLPNLHIIELKYAKKNSLCRILTEQLILPFYIKKMKPDVLHSLSFVIPFAVSRVPQLVTVHDMFHEICAFTISPLKRLYYSVFFNRSIRKADGIFAVSHSTKNDIIRLLNLMPEKITVTALGVRPEFSPAVLNAPIPAHVPNELLVQKYVLFVGGLDPRKNILKLLEAFSLIKDKINVKLFVTGIAGSQKECFDKQIAAYNLQDFVLYTGYLEENVLPFVYARACALIMPSLYEGFGLPVIEAMSMGIPVIASNNSSLRETANGASILVNPMDAHLLARAILDVLHNSTLREKLIKNGFENIKKYTWSYTAAQTMKQYQVFRKDT